jgi:hypothetical protein
MEGSSSCFSAKIESTPKMMMASVTSPTISRLAKLILVRNVIAAGPSELPGDVGGEPITERWCLMA